ncbi:MAG: lytic transglycosylase domain-containing protein, partial [Myxococcales bacterium]|nr:lytic transglycosylase domain-containing protein [Myxococcales bacterium]
MTHRGLIAVVFALVLFSWASPSAHASPEVPMCVADQGHVVEATINVDRPWISTAMCGPHAAPIALTQPNPPSSLAVQAYRQATQLIAAARYEAARLKLDLAQQGLPRIADHIALQNARLELLRGRPDRAAAFFAEASESIHESVRVHASFGYVFALLRADDPAGGEALHDLLWTYPALPEHADLLFEHARSVLRQEHHYEAAQIFHSIRVNHPASHLAPRAEAELKRLTRLGHDAPKLTDEERVRIARELVRTGPLDKAKVAVTELLERPLTPEQDAKVHYLAGRLARYEGRWHAAETYLRTAQGFPSTDVETVREIEDRADDMAQAATAREKDAALAALRRLTARRAHAAIPSGQLRDMIRLASPAGLKEEVDDILVALGARAGVASSTLLDAAMAAVGTGGEGLIIVLLDRVAKRDEPRYRAAALYHLGRAHERGGRPAEARNYYLGARETGDDYYALWAVNGLARLEVGSLIESPEGFSDLDGRRMPHVPQAADSELADQLESVAELHSDTYPWIGRAADLLRIGERNSATAELFEAYLSWRHALGKPVARAGLDSVARADGRVHEPIGTDIRVARLGLSDADRATLSSVSASLGDMGTAGGFAGPNFIETLPRAYEWLAVPAASRYGLDPNLLLAVMRVESAYQKHIVSYAGAVGLMQIMPRTGQLIAHALGHEDFSPADLLDPRTNLEFAAWYLTSLIRRFDGRLPLAIAAYNGGPHNVRRWMQESAAGTSVDVFLEQIPFSQTHRYVRR